MREIHGQYTPRVRVQHVNDEPEVTQQHFRRETDVNFIVAKHDPRALMKQVEDAEAIFADVSGLEDYQSALETVERAGDSFFQLPAAARKVFKQSPARFLDAVRRGRREELVAAGLLPEAVVEAPVRPPAPVEPPAPGPEV